VAEEGIAEERDGGEEKVGDDEGGEVAGEIAAIVEHGEGEGDDGDVEGGGEDVACAGRGEVGGEAVEELEVTSFGLIGF